MRAEQAADIARREEASKREEAARLNAVEELEQVSAQAQMTRAASIKEQPQSASTDEDVTNEAASSRGPVVVLAPTMPRVPNHLPPLLQQAQQQLEPLSKKLPPLSSSSPHEPAGSTTSPSHAPAPPPPGPDDQRPPWDYFVSHVQTETGSYAVDLWSSLRASGSKVWLDVKMDKRDEDAMRRGVAESAAVVVLLSKSYFERPFCLKELVWACELGKPVIPCVPSDLKGFIGEFGGQPPRGGAEPTVAAAPDFLRGILSINVETLDRSDNKYWEVGVGKIRDAERKTIPVRLEEAGVDTLEEAAAAAQSALRARAAEKADAAKKEAEELSEVRRELEAKKKANDKRVEEATKSVIEDVSAGGGGGGGEGTNDTSSSSAAAAATRSGNNETLVAEAEAANAEAAALAVRLKWFD